MVVPTLLDAFGMSSQDQGDGAAYSTLILPEYDYQARLAGCSPISRSRGGGSPSAGRCLLVPMVTSLPLGPF